MPFRVLRALRHLPIRPLSAVLILLALAWLTGHVDRLATLTDRARLAGALLAAGAMALWAARWLAPAVSTGHWVGRRDDAAVHAGGVATWTDIGERASASAMRARAATMRPSLAGRGRWARRRMPVTHYAVPLVRAGWLPAAVTVWSACEEVTLRIGGPRTGKSASLACHGLDAPGALLVTTSRTDLLTATRAVRERRGRVDVFNPTGLGRLESTVRWSPLAGCDDYGTAQRRAADVIPVSASSDGERWDEQARGLLTTLLHAAALTRGSMRTVLDWISPADAVARDQIVDALSTTPGTRAMVAQIRSLYATNDKTLSSITATLLPHLRWVNDATVAEVGDAPLDHPDFLDVAQFVGRGRDSLYLLGRDGGARTLIGALTAEVAHQVRMVAAAMPDDRLDPPMTGLLDEAPLTCGPIPLQRLDGGHGRSRLHAARRRAVPRAVARRLGCQPRRGDPRQHGEPAGLRRSQVRGRPAGRLDALREPPRRSRRRRQPAAAGDDPGRDLEPGRRHRTRAAQRPASCRRPSSDDLGPAAECAREGVAAAVGRGYRAAEAPRCGRSGRPAPPASSQARDGSGPDDRRRSTHDADDAPRAPGRRPMIRRVEPVDHSQALQRLGRDVELLRQDVARVSELSDAVTAHGRSIDQLAALVSQQAWLVEGGAIVARDAGTTPAAGDDEPPAPAWLTIEDPALAITWLNELTVWIPRVWQPYLQTKTPDCWPWHPAVVAEVLVVFHQWQAACLDGTGPDALASWHDRWRPGAAKRTTTAMAGCERSYGRHKVIGVEYAYDLACLDELAEWWAATHGTDADRPAPGLTVQKSGR